MASMEKLQEVLKLVRQTGDKVIVLDNENEPYVVMDLEGYKSLLREEANMANISEEELLDKINRLISAWKASQPDLSDYDLSQFRVDSLRPEKKEEKVVESEPVLEETPRPTEEPEYDYRKATQEELLAQVMEDGDQEYLPEPEV